MGAICINEEILLYINGYYNWISTETIFMNAATVKRIVQQMCISLVFPILSAILSTILISSIIITIYSLLDHVLSPVLVLVLRVMFWKI